MPTWNIAADTPWPPEQADVMPKQAKGSEFLTPGPKQWSEPTAAPSQQAPAAAVAAAIIAHFGPHPGQSDQPFVYLASSERRAEEIGRAMLGFAPEVETLVFPPWDCLPFDRASPSADIMGRRLRVLSCLNRATDRRRVLVTSPDALIQRVVPAPVLATGFMTVKRGETIDRDALGRFAEAVGYRSDDRVDEPGEFAIFGEVIDIFPADAPTPLRIVLGEADTVDEIRTYDPVTQRTLREIDQATIGPASELIFEAAEPLSRHPGIEHRLPEHYGALETLFDALPTASIFKDGRAADRLAQMEEQIAEAYEARQSLGGLEEQTPLPPSRLYLSGDDVARAMTSWTEVTLALDGIGAIPKLSRERHPARAFADLISRHLAQGDRVVLTGLEAEARAMAKALRRSLETIPTEIESWSQATAEPGARLFSIGADIDTGFVAPEQRLVVIASSDVFGGRLATRTRSTALLAAEPDFQIGDIVIHEDHGVGVLRGLETAEFDGVERDVLRLEYHGGAGMLAPVAEIGMIWRYGAEEGAVSLDRLKGDAWLKRKAEVSREIDKTARHLIGLARARIETTASPIEPPRQAYAKFASRFGYPETSDQAAAIDAVLADLAAGHPMDRLVVGDVGFGKTEVALRAAAAVALVGHQVAIVAPTTVLARQHLQTFQRRFAGTGLVVAHLSRLVTSAGARDVRDGLASGEIRVVVGTHALAGKDIGFADLGLMIIDEEQKFGTAVKERLQGLADGGHLLTLTATPIPRTLQAAMVGIQDVSVIASPPARRRPIRTFLVPFDAATVRTALLREKRRGGQSFFVVPRVEDIEPMKGRLASLVPELSVRIAHGKLAADVADEVMVGFADGEGDILLATNIIESGLDVPRANTMMVSRPELFGLSQLHQLRGRVGRSRVQGIAYLLADPEEELPEATRSRLATLEAFDRLGSGLEISARDLDLRGGGDLIGEEQAGHMKLIGAALYQRLLAQAVAAVKGEDVEPDWIPAIDLGRPGAIPTDYVPDAVTRINLYARLGRMADVGEIDGFEEELEDRFGDLPAAAADLLALARLQHLARAAGVRRIDCGPKAVALSFGKKIGGTVLKRARQTAPEATVKEDRLLVPRPEGHTDDPFLITERILHAITST